MAVPGQNKFLGIPLPASKQKAVVELPQMSEEEKLAFVYTPGTPIVNIIPDEVVEKYAIKGVLRNLGFAGVGIVVALGLAFGGGQIVLAQQASQVQALEEERARVQGEASALSPYQAYNTAIDAKRTTMYEQSNKDVDMGDLYDRVLAATVGSDIDLASFAVTQYKEGAEEGGECVNPDPFQTRTYTTESIGCIVFQGEAPNKDSVLQLFAALEDSPEGQGVWFREGFISNYQNAGGTASEEGLSTFSASISFSAEHYTGQYDEFGLSSQQVISGENPDDTPDAAVEPAEGNPETMEG